MAPVYIKHHDINMTLGGSPGLLVVGVHLAHDLGLSGPIAEVLLAFVYACDRSHVPAIIDISKLPYGFQELNQHPLEEQPVLFAAEPSA